MKYLCISIRFLQRLAHCRGNGGKQEWPPSPLRLFQALVASAAAKWNERTKLSHTVPALQWVENLQSPVIVSPRFVKSKNTTQFYVPDNSSELLVPAWKRGDLNKAIKRTEKLVRPVFLDDETVYYLFALSDACPFFAMLKETVRSITHLGWGIDMVVADADLISEAEASRLPGERWSVSTTGGVPLRVPTDGTLADLIRKHTEFLNRLGKEGFRPVAPLRQFEVKQYRRVTDIESRPYCMFTILKPDASGNRAFHPARRTRDVAAWIRHAVAEVCADWPDVAQFVHGHDSNGERLSGEHADHRFQYLPLPTINSHLDRVEAIRRVLVTAPPDCEERIAFIRKRLLGFELKWNNEVIGLLNLAAGKDWVRDQYTGEATTWSSVSPVILPGYNDREANKTHKLIIKALENANLPRELLGPALQYEWQPFGFRAGVDPVNHFARPDNLSGTMIHLRLRFPTPIHGPLAIGAGRYRGFGTMAIEKGE